MTKNALTAVQDDLLKNRSRGKKSAQTSSMKAAWEANAYEQVNHALDPYAEPLETFLKKLADELGLQLSGPTDYNHLTPLDNKGNESTHVAQQCFILVYPDDPLVSYRDKEFTISVFTHYTISKTGEAENINVQIAWDNPKARNSLFSETTGEMYGTSTTYYSFTHAVKNPRASQLEKALAGWIGKLAKESKAFADKVLAADMPKLKLPAHKSRPSEGSSVKVFVSGRFDPSPGLD